MINVGNQKNDKIREGLFLEERIQAGGQEAGVCGSAEIHFDF